MNNISDIKRKSFFLKTPDGVDLWIDRWIPADGVEIKGIIQYHIGMEEYTGRYNELGSFFANEGFVFNAYDFRGHGVTAQNAIKNQTGLIGKIADKNGFNIAVDDLQTVMNECKKSFPQKKVVLIGYSFGSFVCQGFIEKYGKEIEACILCGTKGPTQFVNFMGTILGKIDCLFGRDKKASFLERIPDKMNADRIPKEISRKNRLAWMCSDQSVVEAYISDSMCNNGFVRSFFVDMMGGCYQIHKRKNIRNIPHNLPVLFVYGEDDPVSRYGKTIKKLEVLYKKTGLSFVEEKTYSGCRHEVFQDFCKKQVTNDILSWINVNLDL